MLPSTLFLNISNCLKNQGEIQEYEYLFVKKCAGCEVTEKGSDHVGQNLNSCSESILLGFHYQNINVNTAEI